jgi:hypothetical protein
VVASSLLLAVVAAVHLLINVITSIRQQPSPAVIVGYLIFMG